MYFYGERVIVVWRQQSNFSAISWQGHVNIKWDDDEVRFVLDLHPLLDFYSACSLKQQSADRHVAPLGHIILIPNHPVFALSPQCCVLSGETTNTNLRVFGLTRPGSNQWSTSLEASPLTITPPLQLCILNKFNKK